MRSTTPSSLSWTTPRCHPRNHHHLPLLSSPNTSRTKRRRQSTGLLKRKIFVRAGHALLSHRHRRLRLLRSCASTLALLHAACVTWQCSRRTLAPQASRVANLGPGDVCAPRRATKELIRRAAFLAIELTDLSVYDRNDLAWPWLASRLSCIEYLYHGFLRHCCIYSFIFVSVLLLNFHCVTSVSTVIIPL